MRRTSLAAGLAALGALATLFVALRDRDGSLCRVGSEGERVLTPDTAYVVDVVRDQADLDLEFQPNTRYVVVISSLARTTGTFSVAGTSRQIAAPKFAPRPLAPWRPKVAADDTQASDSQTCDSAIASSRRVDRDPASVPRLAAARAIANTPPNPRAVRAFALHVTDGSLDDPTQYAKVAAHEVAVGRNIRVYLDDQQSRKELAPGLVETIADLLDNELIPRFATVFGTYRDVDGDGRFSVLLSPWLARLQGGRTSIGGFVRGSDFQAHVAPPFSNGCDMMYVNSQTIPGPHLRTLLIHEYTHAVSFSRRSGGADGRASFPEEEDWLNEALAHCAESLFEGGWTNLDYRISRYLNDTAVYPLVVEDYYRSGLWRCHGCRGATYLFLRYCVERFGSQTLTRLIGTPARGAHNLELATGCSFERLFRDWTLSLIDGSPSAAKSQTQARCGHALTGQLAPLDLYGPVGRWGLAGPRPKSWDIDSASLTVELKGTSAAFVEMSASRAFGVRRIHLNGTRGMQLQVSLVRVLDDSPQIEIDGAWSRRTSPHGPITLAASRADTDNVLKVTVRASRGEDLVIEQISLEQNVGENRVSVCLRGDSIRPVEITSPRPSTAKAESLSEPALGPLRDREFELPSDQFSDPTCPVTIKVVAIDRQGRRSAGWGTVRERGPQQVAAVTPIRR
ncbi:MAG TPA: hypothetical protein VGP63_11225 [Planctomycetaceae bacterium]|jgi:hypothetical protein|nr:hypothetical protein [Planctomycetaceae bacterium]